MTDEKSEFRGTCYCGAVEVTVQGPPAASAFCHCTSCRKWHAAPVNAWSIWPADMVTITGDVVTAEEHDASRRVACARCGGAVANRKPLIDMVVVYAMTLAGSGLPFKPASHIFYAERVMDFADGLPKYADTPEAFGGSGNRIEEPKRTRWRG